MSELKACPFCGRKNVLINTISGGHSFTCVYCEKTITIPKALADSVEAWNTRPNDAKAMIYQGLRELSWVDNGDKSLAELIDDELSSVGGSFSSQDMIDALYEVCKQSSEGE